MQTKLQALRSNYDTLSRIYKENEATGIHSMMMTQEQIKSYLDNTLAVLQIAEGESRAKKRSNLKKRIKKKTDGI